MTDAHGWSCTYADMVGCAEWNATWRRYSASHHSARMRTSAWAAIPQQWGYSLARLVNSVAYLSRIAPGAAPSMIIAVRKIRHAANQSSRDLAPGNSTWVQTPSGASLAAVNRMARARLSPKGPHTPMSTNGAVRSRNSLPCNAASCASVTSSHPMGESPSVREYRLRASTTTSVCKSGNSMSKPWSMTCAALTRETGAAAAWAALETNATMSC